MNYLVGDIGNTLIKLSILNSSYKIKKYTILKQIKYSKIILKQNI